MSFPTSKSLEIPILQELAAVRGEDDIRYIYSRLIGYFPQLTDEEISSIQQNKIKNWRILVQKAGKELDEKGFIKRKRGFWKITENGQKQVEAEAAEFELTIGENKKLSHIEVQKILLQIGEILGYYSEIEFEYYDVVWREVPRAARLSHVFEVQSKGNIDSALAKLKRAYEAQRSKIFLVIASERDLNRAKKSLTQEFQDIEKKLTILTFAQVQKVLKNINSIKDELNTFLES